MACSQINFVIFFNNSLRNFNTLSLSRGIFCSFSLHGGCPLNNNENERNAILRENGDFFFNFQSYVRGFPYICMYVWLVLCKRCRLSSKNRQFICGGRQDNDTAYVIDMQVVQSNIQFLRFVRNLLNILLLKLQEQVQEQKPTVYFLACLNQLQRISQYWDKSNNSYMVQYTKTVQKKNVQCLMGFILKLFFTVKNVPFSGRFFNSNCFSKSVDVELCPYRVFRKPLPCFGKVPCISLS